MSERARKIRYKALHRELYLAMMCNPVTEADEREYHLDYLRRKIITGLQK